ncbi:MAG: hypothetical protein GPI94_17985 [Microcystis aeruginosa LG13-03]|nr:hypothetical protein [Microcystis aeruginosa LG13-13]NCR05710.1 hypothetical protein [Microcystis aeruginosa LG13-03]NCR63979.1 hypothetical protein [Microcystis aeruginosa LG11-05]
MSEELKSVGGEFKGFTSREKAEAAVTIEVTTGLGKKYGLRIGSSGFRVLIFVMN